MLARNRGGEGFFRALVERAADGVVTMKQVEQWIDTASTGLR